MRSYSRNTGSNSSGVLRVDDEAVRARFELIHPAARAGSGVADGSGSPCFRHHLRDFCQLGRRRDAVDESAHAFHCVRRAKACKDLGIPSVDLDQHVAIARNLQIGCKSGDDVAQIGSSETSQAVANTLQSLPRPTASSCRSLACAELRDGVRAALHRS